MLKFAEPPSMGASPPPKVRIALSMLPEDRCPKYRPAQSPRAGRVAVPSALASNDPLPPKRSSASEVKITGRLGVPSAISDEAPRSASIRASFIFSTIPGSITSRPALRATSPELVSSGPPGLPLINRFSVSTWVMSVSSKRPDRESLSSDEPSSVRIRMNNPSIVLSSRKLPMMAGPIRPSESSKLSGFAEIAAPAPSKMWLKRTAGRAFSMWIGVKTNSAESTKTLPPPWRISRCVMWLRKIPSVSRSESLRRTTPPKSPGRAIGPTPSEFPPAESS